MSIDKPSDEPPKKINKGDMYGICLKIVAVLVEQRKINLLGLKALRLRDFSNIYNHLSAGEF